MSSDDLNLTLEWGGGAEMLFGNVKKRQVTFKADQPCETLKSLLEWLKNDSGFLTQKPDLFFSGETIRPGIIVLINDSDWELHDGLEYRLENGDRICFISTLHGG